MARIFASLMLCLVLFSNVASSAEPGWPEITQSALPWTRWWWHGSAVDKENLTRCLELYHEAGLGGVEVTCIYGVKKTRDRQLRYLSKPWLEAVEHAISEAQRLGMGVDIPPGSGWRMGGPRVRAADGNAVFSLVKPTTIVAYGPDGQMVDLTGKLDLEEKQLVGLPEDWQEWKIYTLSEQPINEQVKRPAPGGRGRNINPYNRESVENFLTDFGKRTESIKDGIRASFHDSFEYEGNWSKSFLKKFAENRGYRLEEHLPALAGEGDRDLVARVKSDYRETMSDLVLDELITPWVDWAHSQGQLARNQSHGSPANWLDLYAACDIPETETFGQLHKSDANPLVLKFASSAAHVAGRPLVSCESATWLEQHFTETLALLKERLDRQMLAGINHVIYHGTAYSPQDAAWPGWLFYASTELNPQNPIWHDFPALNKYVARSQALLQAGEPSNDVLIYWPIYDLWHSRRGTRMQFAVHSAVNWFEGEPIGKLAKKLDRMGVSFDYISDRQIMQTAVDGKQVKTPGATYRAIVIPTAEFMPPETLAKLAELAKAGVPVLFYKEFPRSAPGLITEEKALAFPTALAAAKESAAIGDDLKKLVTDADVKPEPFVAETPLRSIRRKVEDGWIYLLKNTSDKDFDGRIAVNVDWATPVLMDAMTGEIGMPEITADRKLRVQLPVGGTVFLRTYSETVAAKPWQYQELSGEPINIPSAWTIKFVAGGPELPATTFTDELGSWTKLAGEKAEVFAGTGAYTTTITPADGAGRYLLDLGKVADSARVFLNGQELGVLFAPPFRLPVELQAGENELTVEVTNVAANRIRDLDRRKVKWQIFEDINFVGINFKDNKYLPFNAAKWPIRDAGLLGPVTLQKLGGANAVAMGKAR
jgi:hypothetical protein